MLRRSALGTRRELADTGKDRHGQASCTCAANSAQVVIAVEWVINNVTGANGKVTVDMSENIKKGEQVAILYLPPAANIVEDDLIARVNGHQRRDVYAGHARAARRPRRVGRSLRSPAGDQLHLFAGPPHQVRVGAH